jgi:hypothetical protein
LQLGEALETKADKGERLGVSPPVLKHHQARNFHFDENRHVFENGSMEETPVIYGK